MVGLRGVEGYLAMTGIVGVCGVTPLAIVSGFFLLLAKGRIALFVISGMVIGFVITLWPVLLWPLRLMWG